MIDIQDKSYCCGCGACAQRCPQSCITMQEDDKGFLYPVVDEAACVGCGLCEQACPFLNEGVDKADDVPAFAAVNSDRTIRESSSSGGVFSLLARLVMAHGGMVFGARFDEAWNVVHDGFDDMEAEARFRGSKYVQSVIGDTYSRAESLLKQGRPVLFSGTPCQIAGLRHFLGKEYDNLLLVEVACHGVPSPKVWREYLADISRKTLLTEVNFRSKTTGWKDYSVRIGSLSRRHDDDEYMGCFIKNYSLRPSCFNCRFKAGQSGADITLADLWGIETIAPHLDDGMGTSLVIVHTEKGRKHLEECPLKQEPVRYASAVKANPSLEHPATRPEDYEAFWRMFNEDGPRQALNKYGKLYPSGLLIRLKRLASRLLSKMRAR